MSQKERINQEQIYSIRVLYPYIEYMKQNHSLRDDDLSALVSSAGIYYDLLNDEHAWISQEQADRFYDLCVYQTGDADIAYNVGKFASLEQSAGIIAPFIKSFLSPSVVYKFLPKISSKYTKASRFVVEKTSNGKAVISSKKKDWCNEKEYQCQNRKGLLEAVPIFFGKKAATATELSCMHKGGDCCRYELQWEPDRISPHWYFHLAIVILFFAYTLLSGAGSVTTLSVSLSLTVLLLIANEFWHRLQKLSATDKINKELLERALHDSERRSRELRLLHEIGLDISNIPNLDQLMQVAAEKVCQVLGYDRSIIMSVLPEEQALGEATCFGFPKDLEDLIKHVDFKINPENNSGFFIRAVNSKMPVLIPEVEKELNNLSTRSRHFAKRLKSKSFLVVPILFKGSPLGIVAVDYVNTNAKLGERDVKMLKDFANQLAVSIANANHFSDSERARNRSELAENNERQLRMIFQKYVPSEIINSAKQFDNLLDFVSKPRLTVMFSDIRKFTTLSEQLPPEDVIAFLNNYYRLMAPAIEENNGFINNYLGDGILAIFKNRHSHASDAVRAASQMLEICAEINAQIEIPAPGDFYPIRIGIGIHSGERSNSWKCWL
jgi:hypothetical protein